ncbi:MAG: ABC transporter ATP-binding protein [Lachnospiraceae bacterium]|nr:ABC transporter ATP-binding protein [Lachnospiraceae bacterium]
MSLLKIKDVCKYYGNEANVTQALDKVNFEIQKGEFVGIMGASGSGKTTMLNCISTIDTVTSGHIFYDEMDITEMKSTQLAEFRRRNLGFVFQDFNLLDTLTVEENISLALTINKADAKEIPQKVEEMADMLGIKPILKRFPYEISGGQKQRCACARALINNPKLILADEPTGALDSKSAQLLLETMEKMNKQLHATILMVTHDAFSASYAQRILFLKDGNLFKELSAKGKGRREFYNEILNVLVLLGGETNGAY